MGHKHSLNFSDIASGATADAFTTLLAIIAPAGTGKRCRLLALSIGPAEGAPQDVNYSVRVNRTNQATAGTPTTTVAAADIPKADPNSVDSICTAGRTYTVEPTTYETEPLFEAGVNSRGAILKEWPEGTGPQFGPSKTLGILVAPRTNTAVNVSGCVEWEEEF